MKPEVTVMPALEAGLLRAAATLQDPDVRIAPWSDELPVLVIEEGGVVLELEFPDLESLTRFVRRLTRLLASGRRRT
jgi:hypothetical protein